LLVHTSGCTFILDREAVQCDVSEDCVRLGSDNTICQDNLCVAALAGGTSDDATTTDLSGDESSESSSVIDGCPQQNGAEGVPFLLSVRITAAGTGQTPPGMTAVACNMFDVECLEPIQPETVEADGRTSFPLNSGARVYVLADAPGLIPALAMVPERLYPDTSGQVRLRGEVAMLPPLIYQVIAESLGIVLDPTAARILIGARTCEGETAAGKSVTIDEPREDTRVVYFDESTQADPDATETSAAGAASIVNAPHMPILRMLNSDGSPFYDEIRVLTSAERITYVELTGPG